MAKTSRPAPNPAKILAWDDFRLIAAIAEARTLPAAAARLGMDHSTVFRRLRQIEGALGTPLFERHRAGYELTAAGAEIASLATRVEEDITAVMHRLAGQSPSPAGEVRLATSDALLFDLLLPLLADFRAACPEVRLDLVVGNTALNLSRRDADVAIRATSAPPDTLTGRRIAHIAWAAYAPHGTPAMDDPFATGAPWIGFGDALASLAAAALLRERVAAPHIPCHFDTVCGIAAGIEAGLGHGLLPCFVGDPRRSLTRLGAPIATLGTDLWLLTHADLRNVPRVRVLLDFLATRLTTLRPLIGGELGG